MKWMNYFGEYQPLEGRVGFIFREAYKAREDYYYKTHYSLTGDGMFYVLIDKSNLKNIYEIKTTKKKARPAKAPIKDAIKKDIIDVFLDYVQKAQVFNEKELASVETFSKGITLRDAQDGLIMIDIIKKRKLPE